jgi:hypothetical protein
MLYFMVRLRDLPPGNSFLNQIVFSEKRILVYTFYQEGFRLFPFMTQSQGPSDCPGRFNLVRYRANDCEPEEAERIRLHIEQCESCRVMLADLNRRQEEFLKTFPMKEFVAGVKELYEKKLQRRRRLILTLVPCAAVLLLVVGAFLLWPRGQEEKGGTRTKGGPPELAFFLQKGDQAVPGKDGDTLKAGDRIQFVYTTGEHRYLFLVSIDEAGNVANYNPGDSASSIRIQPGIKKPIEGSIILDESPNSERVFAIFSNEPLTFDEVSKAAKRAFEDLKSQGKTIKDLTSLPLEQTQVSALLLKK